jgi:tripartite-type tricarboxylate transporter receptor subunit TctC
MRSALARLLLVTLFTVPSLAGAQPATGWPTKSVRLIVPAAAGGPTDIVGRVVAAELSATLGQQVWVDNRVGAGHLIGMTAGAAAEPDGYTFLVVTTPFVVAPWLQKKMPYDMKDLQPVVWMTSSPFVLVVPPSLPVRTVQELVTLAKQKPGQLNMASAGPATGPHLAGELFRLSADIRVQHVAYRGGPQAETAILRGEATFLFDTPSGALPHVEAGAMRALAVTSLKRMDNAPDIPTIAESGFPGFEADSWNGLVAPAGVPKTIVARMEAAVADALKKPEVKARLAAAGFAAVGALATDFAKLIERDLAKWEKVVKQSGMTAE